MSKTNEVWQQVLSEVRGTPDYQPAPRGMRVSEKIAHQYTVPMPAYLTLSTRKVNKAFMFAEAAWIISGSNRLSKLEHYMKRYSDFSDDGVFLRGAYGPKIVDQLGYVVDALDDDNDTRQAVMNIWRERPGKSKDIPCTTGIQFLVRDGALHAVVTMRSQDVVLGFTYDVFTFSMIAKAVQLLLRERGTLVTLGNLTVTAGSMHIYANHYKNIHEWLHDTSVETESDLLVHSIMSTVDTYEQLIRELWHAADRND